MNGATVRRCREGDIPLIGEIFREFADFHASIDPVFRKAVNAPDLFLSYVAMNIESESSLVLVAEKNGRISGYCIGKMMMKPPGCLPFMEVMSCNN